MSENIFYEIKRPSYSYQNLSNDYKEENVKFNLVKSVKYKTKLCKPAFKSIVSQIFPFPFIMSTFYCTKYLVFDLMAGLTMLVFHIPQGMAYGLLAGLQPINGLYASFFPPLIYVLFGTSRHLSLGTFAIMALLARVSVFREVATVVNILKNETNGFQYNVTTDETNINNDNFEMAKLQISIATTLLSGLIQLLMGIFRLGYLMNYVNDALIGGFTCATAFHVIMSQMGNILGYSIKNYSSVGEFPYKLYLLLANITELHWITFGISSICILILVVFTEIVNPYIQKKIKFPLPIQLIMIIIATIISYYLTLGKKYSVNIVGPIPKGLPKVIIPNFFIWPKVLIDAVLLAIVSFVMNSALVKIYALKFNYHVDYNQEFVAYGLSNIFGSFFQCILSSGALARSAVVVNVGMKSQLASLVSCAVMLFVLLFIGPLFEHVPTSVLSTIIVVSLKTMLLQITSLSKLYGSSKYDFFIWIVAFLATILLNVPLGLVVGFLFSLLTIIIRMQNPKTVLLGQLPNTNLYYNVKEYKDATELPGIKIFRFDAPIYFANAEYFRIKLYKKIGTNPSNGKKCISNNTNNETEVRNDEVKDVKSDLPLIVSHSNNPNLIQTEIKYIILDFSAINYVDNVALRILDDIQRSFMNIGIEVLLAAPNYEVRTMLIRSNFPQNDIKSIMFVSLHDAVLFASIK